MKKPKTPVQLPEYTVHVTSLNDGRDSAVCTYDGVDLSVLTRNGVVYAMSRKLLNAGAPDGIILLKGKTSTARANKPMSVLKDYTLLENDRGLRRVKWHSPPESRAA